MMIIRLIILVALVGLMIFAYRKLTGSSPSQNNTPVDPSTMKKCEHCGIHLPQEEGCHHKEHFFCSDQHRQTYLEQHPDARD